MPEVMAQEGGGMSQCFIKLAGLAGSVLHLSILSYTKVSFCDMRTAGSGGHLGQTRNGLLLQCLRYQLKAFIPMHPAWIIQ